MRGKMLRSVLVLAFLLPLAAGAGQAQEPVQDGDTTLPTGPGAGPTVTVGPDGIEWQPEMEYASATLIVSGPEGTLPREEFPAGVPLFFAARDQGGDPLPDGQYTYEIRFQPVLSPQAEAALVAAAESPDRDRVAAELVGTGELSAQGRIVWGHFRISEGVVVTGGVSEPVAADESVPTSGLTLLATADQVIADDLIVQGHACIGGTGCVDGEDLGWAPLRLKNDNVRMHFVDTSTGDSPTNDWRIVINDSGTGGADYFAVKDEDANTVPFKIAAGASDNALYVSQLGSLGLHTAAPYGDTGIGETRSVHILCQNTPIIRLEQDNTAGWSAQTWDVAGNEANFFIRDVTHSFNLPFRIRTGAPQDSLTIREDGDVGMGTWSPEAALHLRRDGGAAKVLVDERSSATATRTLLELSNKGAPQIALTDRAAGSTWYLSRNDEDGFTVVYSDTVISQSHTALQLDPSGNLVIEGALTEASDVALKENRVPVAGEAVLDRILQLPVSTWNYRADDDAVRHMGPMAQDFYRLFGLGADDEHIAPLDVNGVTLAGLQELTRQVQEQEAQIEQLQQENQDLEQRVDALEALVQKLLEAQEGDHD